MGRDWLSITSKLARITSAVLVLLLAPLLISHMFTTFSITLVVAEPQELALGVGGLVLLVIVLVCTWWVTRR